MPERTKPERNGSPTGREFATVEQRLNDARAEIKNLRDGIDSIYSAARDQERRLADLRLQLEHVRTRLSTGIAVATAVVSAAAWAVAFFR